MEHKVACGLASLVKMDRDPYSVPAASRQGGRTAVQ